jgi:hypothetical protein
LIRQEQLIFSRTKESHINLKSKHYQTAEAMTIATKNREPCAVA